VTWTPTDDKAHADAYPTPLHLRRDTFWVLNALRGASDVVLLTRLGGGAFGDVDKRIYAAMLRALEMVCEFDLDLKLVTYATPSPAIVQMAKHFG
jgi:hypothetical protein